ncbi:MAG: hypothetical protein H7329_18190 [Opitutaceae bacterium]|nr:hypothetical protein [Cytophagales bacterium]
MINLNWSDLDLYYLRYDKDAWIIIGGKVLLNHQTNPNSFENSCAIRVSRALNKSGCIVPYLPGRTLSGVNYTWHFYRVKDLKAFLINRYDIADIISTDRKKFSNKRGVICFDISYLDASGHFTLFDGINILGGEHDTDYYFQNASNIYLWIV